jgi:hypothetical protein
MLIAASYRQAHPSAAAPGHSSRERNELCSHELVSPKQKRPAVHAFCVTTDASLRRMMTVFRRAVHQA